MRDDQLQQIYKILVGEMQAGHAPSQGIQIMNRSTMEIIKLAFEYEAKKRKVSL